MYLPDLSLAESTPGKKSRRTFNVGWLDANHPFTNGTVPEEFLERLWRLCIRPAVMTRGFHECSFCPKEGKAKLCTRNGQSVRLGSGMVRIHRAGKTYVAPDLIYHYVADHGYRPPDEFIAAVMQYRNWLQRKADWLIFNSQ